MHWKLKASIQHGASLLPQSLSYPAYYWLQRHFGGLRTNTPIERLHAGIEIWKRIRAQGINPVNRVFFEVGTGTATMVPLALWLLGAERTVTADLNPYLKEEIVRANIGYIAVNREEVRTLFGSMLRPQRFRELLRFWESGRFSLQRFLALCAIDYRAPADATGTGLPDGSVDFHTSYTVFEHIPPDVLRGILAEGNRIVRGNGLFVHMIDYSDHFAHSDRTLLSVNFLRFSNVEWARYAGNRYAYTNRLRHDDFLALFEAAGHQVLATVPRVDPIALELLRRGRIHLDPRFTGKPPDVLAISNSWIVSKANARSTPA